MLCDLGFKQQEFCFSARWVKGISLKLDIGQSALETQKCGYIKRRYETGAKDGELLMKEKGNG